MTLASTIANMLVEKGFKGFYPWTSKNSFGYERIYHKAGYVELSGNNGFQAIDIDDNDFVQACKDCVTEYIASKPKAPSYDLPF
jgi:hypothetical protein